MGVLCVLLEVSSASCWNGGRGSRLIEHQFAWRVKPIGARHGGLDRGTDAHVAQLCARISKQLQTLEQVEPDRLQPVLLDRERHPVLAPLAPGGGGERPLPHQVGQHPERWRRRPVRYDQRPAKDRLRRAGEGGLELQAALGETTPGHLRQGRRGHPAELRLQRVVQAQLQTPAEVVPQARM